VVVVREGDATVIAEVAGARFGRTVTNLRASEGQLTSLIAGLDAIDGPGIDGALVTLVDVPLVRAETVRVLLARAGTSAAPVVRAVHQGRHGHPVIVSRRLFDELRRADPAVGAKAVLRAHPIEDVEVPDPGVAEDIDTPDEYARVQLDAVNQKAPNP
jgi:molybdenum cofactor cytidylyltransferase